MERIVTSSRRYRLLITLMFALACSMGACADKVPSRKDLAVEPGATADIVTGISNDAGKLIASGNGRAERTVIVFEETHASGLGQLEIALMLVRLHDRHNLRQVSLEGAIFDKGVLPTKWFHDLTGTAPAKRAGQEAAVRLLKEGEISAAEFISLVMPDVQVRGNERADEYDVKLSDKASGASIEHLIAIAEKSLSQDQIVQVNQMIRAGKEKEAVEFIIASDSWANERYKKLTSEESILSTEELSKILEEIEAKAKDVSAEVREEDRKGLREETAFFKTATKRSQTMVDNTFAMSDQSPKSLVALIIGVAHSPGVIELLKAGKASYALVSPVSLVAADKSGTLTTPAYNRKNELKSVDEPGRLGAYLDGRHKPPSNVGVRWLQIKTEIFLISTLVAEASAGGEKPPFKSLENMFKSLQFINIDPSSYKLIKRDGQPQVMFKIIARIGGNDPNRTVEIWDAPWKESSEPPVPLTVPTDSVSLEQLLQDARKEEGNEPKNEDLAHDLPPPPEGVSILPISRKTKAAFSTNEAAVKNVLERG